MAVQETELDQLEQLDSTTLYSKCLGKPKQEESPVYGSCSLCNEKTWKKVLEVNEMLCLKCSQTASSTSSDTHVKRICESCGHQHQAHHNENGLCIICRSLTMDFPGLRCPRCDKLFKDVRSLVNLVNEKHTDCLLEMVVGLAQEVQILNANNTILKRYKKAIDDNRGKVVRIE